ncbi:GNAT family N-acetyltransferase [Paenibacillus sp. VCA1]|uniref:GNAT family N-acetyltransferase n=1 Tax=Paenibacillus sp. VCA1 TaxID=3039148 RepID=UPI0028717528|nr:GNAT family N-acetyltransferase [Paenibacillus sp. VCA1]MDR9854697.1 GNAT family N-acetyltransferase [Paenibacillus sp. VCA1]
MQNRKATANDVSLIIDIWERSVMATHHFLSVEDRQEIRKEIPLYLPHVDVRLWYANGACIGFSGINNNHLEMLFLDPGKIGQGYGRQILHSLIRDFHIQTIDVNKQNGNAVRFYLKSGFKVIREDATDSAGRPYPILHLKYADH